jgi:hypothetical protein
MDNVTNSNTTAPTTAISLARQSLKQLCIDWDLAIRRAELPAMIFSNAPLAATNKQDLIEVCQTGDISALQVLIRQGIDFPKDGFAAMKEAVLYGQPQTLKRLLESGGEALVHHDDDFLLRQATSQGNRDLVRHLLDHGADVHVKNDAAMRNAVTFQTPKIAFLLLEYSAPSDLLSEAWTEKWAAFQEIQKKRMISIHTKETLGQIFQAKTWAGHTHEMQELWGQVPKPLRGELDFSSALAQARVQTLKASKPKVTITQ